MNRFVIATAVAAMATPALAADVIYDEPVAPAPVIVYDPAFVWTGFYAGATVGYNFDNATRISAFDSVGGRFSHRYLNDDDGINAGLFAGYNYQWDNVVVGAEADVEYLDSQDSRLTFGAQAGPGSSALTGADQSWQGSLRARLGYSFDRVLVYATGGLAIGDIDYRVTEFNAAGTAFDAASSTSTETGYTVGGGVDFAATDAIFVRGEYRFTDYGTRTVSTANNSYEFDTRSHALKVGVGFHF